MRPIVARRVPTRALLFLGLLAGPAIPASAAVAACATDDRLYTVTPCSGSPGGAYKIVIKRDPSVQPANAQYDSDYTLQCALVDPQGSKIAVAGFDASQAGFWTGSLIVDQSAPLGENFLLLRIYPSGAACADPAHAQPPPHPVLQELLPFRITSAASPGPAIPPNAPQVDVAWKVLSKNVVSDSFGARIAKMYYGIVVYLGNNAGYDLQLAGVYFKLPAGAGVTAPLPTDSYRTVRSSLQREQLIGVRNTSVNLVRALGPILTGVLPFFDGSTAAARNHKYNFQTFLNVLSNPFERMLELVLPDLTVNQLVALDNQALRDGAVISNNSSTPLLVFVDKGTLAPLDPLDPGPGSAACAPNDWNCDYMRTRYKNRRYLRSRFKSDHDPLQVMQALGELTLIGKYVAYSDRVTFNGKAMPLAPAPSAPPASAASQPLGTPPAR
jgi:hypothetical protein